MGFEMTLNGSQLRQTCDFVSLPDRYSSALDRGGPAAVFVCYDLVSHDTQSTRSASGVLHQMPLGTAALRGKERRSGS